MSTTTKSAVETISRYKRELKDERNLLEELYIRQGLSLAEVMRVLSSEYGLCYSKGQVRNQIAKFGLKKTITQPVWNFIDRNIRNRHSQGKASEVYINDRLLKHAKLKKELSRNVVLTLKPSQSNISEDGVTDTQNIWICTPPACHLLPSVETILPWHAFTRNMMAQVDFNPNIATLPPLLPAANPMTTMQHLLPVFGTSSESETAKFWSSRIIESENNSVVGTLRHIVGNQQESALFHSLRYMVYMLSNNLASEGDCLNLVKFLVESNQTHFVITMAHSTLPTARAVLQKIFCAAVELGDRILVKDLLSIPNFEDTLQQHPNPLRIAVRNGDKVLVELLLAAGADLWIDDDLFDLSRASILEMALRQTNSAELVGLLLAYGAGVEILDPEGIPGSILISACLTSSTIDTLSLLIDAGADVNMIDKQQRSTNEDETWLAMPLQAAVWSVPHLAVIQFLIDHGADVDCKEVENYTIRGFHDEKSSQFQRLGTWTPLTIAAWFGATDIIKYLIDAGANPNLSLGNVYKNGFQSRAPGSDCVSNLERICIPLEAAMVAEHYDCFELLLSRGAVPDAEHIKHMLEIAFETQDYTCIEVLQLHRQEIPDILNGTSPNLDRHHVQRHSLVAILTQDLPAGRYLAYNAYLSENLEIHLYCQIALAAMCRSSPHCWGSECRSRTSRPLVCRRTASTMLKLLEHNVNYKLEPLDSCSWLFVREYLLQGDFSRIAQILRRPDSCDRSYPQPNLPADLMTLRKLKDLLKRGANPNGFAICHGLFTTPLLVATRCGDRDQVYQLLLHGADPNFSVTGWRSDSALLHAISKGHRGVTELLIQYGSTLRGIVLPRLFWWLVIPQRDGSQFDFSFAKRLVEIGADVNSVLQESKIVVSIRRGGNYWDFICRTPLQYVTFMGMKDGAIYLLDHGADVNAKAARHRGLTALQAAAIHGSVELVSLYIDVYGANVDPPLSNIETGFLTTLQAAAAAGHLDVVKALLKAGADVNFPPAKSHGQTALQAAAMCGDLDIVKTILKTGADVNSRPGEYHGATALQAASMKGFLPVAQLSLERGADVSAPGSLRSGRTALQGAAEHGRLDMLQLLLNHYRGPDWREACVDAAKYAQKEGQTVAARFLLEYARD